MRIAVIAVLFAPAAGTQEEGQVRRVCRMVAYVRVCEDVYYPAPPPAPVPAARHATDTESTIRYNADNEERKAQLQAIERGGTSDRGNAARLKFVPATLPDDRSGRLPEINNNCQQLTAS